MPLPRHIGHSGTVAPNEIGAGRTAGWRVEPRDVRLFRRFSLRVATGLCAALVAPFFGAAVEARTASGTIIITLTQSSATPRVGDVVTVNADVRDRAGQPVGNGEPFIFTVTRPDGTVAPAAYPLPYTVGGAGYSANGFWQVNTAGIVTNYGDAPDLGDLEHESVDGAVVAMAATTNADGYWLATDSGQVFGFGSVGNVDVDLGPLDDESVVGITAAGAGLRVVTDRGRVLNHNASPHGDWGSSTGADRPVVSIAGTPTGEGYWLLDARGAVVARGDATWHGDVAQWLLLGSPTQVVATPSGQGYAIVSTAGPLYSFGDAQVTGWSRPDSPPSPAQAIVMTPTGKGHWLFRRDGRAEEYGDAKFIGIATRTVLKLGKGTFSFTMLEPGPTKVVFNLSGTTATVTQDWSRGAEGYWMLGDDGAVHGFGSAAVAGDEPHLSIDPQRRAVDLEPTPDGAGYWIVDDDGGVYAHGSAWNYGRPDVRFLAPGEIVTSLSATPTGAGYWIFTSRGRVFPAGDAQPFGDLGAIPLNGPVLDSVSTPTGKGYFMVADDGGIFAFGDARFAGSMGGRRLNAPVQSLVPDRDGAGYWLVASDGGIFAFDAPFKGSMGATHLNRPITGMFAYGDAYLMAAEDGGVFNFASKPFLGSLGGHPPTRPIVAVAARPSAG